MAALSSSLADQAAMPPAWRKEAVARLGVSVPATAVAFALLAPLMGALLTWTLLTVIPTLAAVKDVGAVAQVAMEALPRATATAYTHAVIPAILAGAMIALLSPFSPNREQFIAGVGAVGAFAIYVEAELLGDPSLPTPLFLAIIGSATAILCTMTCHHWPLGRLSAREARRDRLARERAARLKAERIPQPPARR
jgi:peptidoglycan/LPS O-acetylase OafA/YrhL